MDRNLQTLEGRHHWGSLPLYFAQGCLWAVQLMFGCFLVFCFAWVRGGRGHDWPGQALNSQDPCSKRIRKSSPLKPNCELNTTCCRNLKISGLTAVSKTTDANALESCQSEILFESQVTFLYPFTQAWTMGSWTLSAVSRKAYALYSCIIYLLFISLCNSALISWNMEAIRISSHAIILYMLRILWGKLIFLIISLLKTLIKIKWSQKHMVCIDKCSVHAKLLQLYPTLCDLMDCNPPGSSVLGILWARILEWDAMPSPRGSSWLRDQTHVFCVSCIAGRFFTTEPPESPDQCRLVLKYLIIYTSRNQICVTCITGVKTNHYNKDFLFKIKNRDAYHWTQRKQHLL